MLFRCGRSRLIFGAILGWEKLFWCTLCITVQTSSIFQIRSRYDAKVSRDSVVAIDNAPHTRQEARRLYDRIRWGQKDYTGPRNVILITREPIDDAVRRIELTLTDTDIVHIENIIRQQFGESDFETISQYDRQRSGLWWYVKTLAQKAE